MRRLLGISTAALVGLAAPAAFASLIPGLTTVGIVSGGAQFTYTTVLSTDQEVANFLTLSGGALGPSTTLVNETGFLTGFLFATGPNDITLSCPTGPCSTDQSGGTTAEFTIASPATGTILGNFTSQTTETGVEGETLSVYSETSLPNSGSISVPAAIPEPASLAIFAAALAGFGLLGRRRRKYA